jgi:glycosyltransferase involved in cell wall biosynthesis
MPVVLLVLDARTRLTMPAISDTIRILRMLNFRVIFLARAKRSARAYLPKEVEVSETALSGVFSKGSDNVFLHRFFMLFDHILVALSLLRLCKSYDLVIFSHCLMPLPVLISRILARNPLVYVAGIPLSAGPEYNLATRMIAILENLCYRWSKGILVVSSSLVKRPPLSKYSQKAFEAPIRICDERFLARFSYSPPSGRRDLVGFVSRLAWEKGALEFVRSIPHIISRKSDTDFLIVGDGPLRDRVLQEVGFPEVKKRVTMIPWTNTPEIYLKRMKLLALPSRSEGIPSVVLEAMACGTPVLVTRVGGLADLLDDGKNAFLLNNTEIEYLAVRILEILERPDLDDISKNAYAMLLSHYNQKKILTDWRSAFETIFRAQAPANEQSLNLTQTPHLPIFQVQV